MNNLRRQFLLLCLFTVSAVSYAQEKRFPIGNSVSLLNNFRRQLETAQSNDINRLQLQLSSTRSLTAVINHRQSSGVASEQLSGSIANTPNSCFYLMIENHLAHGYILLRDSKKAYTYSSDSNGNVFVEETDINKIVCIDYRQAEDSVAPPAADGATTAMDPATFYDLQSYPGGNGCVLLDFDGEHVPGVFLWNNGNPIDAAPSNVSDADKQLAWEYVSEGFRPFSLNITTSVAVFNSYPADRRMRCIFTTTTTAAPGYGGVALIGAFQSGQEIPCWVFNSRGRAPGVTAIHEIGHSFGLIHEGRLTPSEIYFLGQGNWAPIMGDGYYKSIVQWSKGEYLQANNREDELTIMTSYLYHIGYRADDYGNSTSAATLLPMDATGNVSNNGIIERTADVDMFSFTTGGGPVNLTFNPNAIAPTLDILATLYDSTGTAIASSDLPGLSAGISAIVAPGKYYVSVTGTGADDPQTTGYSNYGSLGTYNITGRIPPVPVIVLSLDLKDNGNPLPKPKDVTSLVISPNPAANQVKVQYGKRNTNFDVTIRDANGIAVYTGLHINNGQQINIARLPSGLYFIIINTGKQTITTKLVKQSAY